MLFKANCDAVITNEQCAHMAKYVRETIAGIAETEFKKDPLVVDDLSQTISEVSSAYKRHGLVLEEALRTALNTRTDLTAWGDNILVPVRQNPIQVDLLTFEATTGTLAAYEVKRGFSNQDSEARHSVKDRLTSLHGVLPNYAKSKNLRATKFKVAVVGYYDPLSTRLGPHQVIASPDLSTEFGTKTMGFVGDVNDYYQHCLERNEAPHLVRALQQIAERSAFRDAVSPASAVFTQFEAVGAELGGARHPWDALGV
jgi:hypothetical protein